MPNKVKGTRLGRKTPAPQRTATAAAAVPPSLPSASSAGKVTSYGAGGKMVRERDRKRKVDDARVITARQPPPLPSRDLPSGPRTSSAGAHLAAPTSDNGGVEESYTFHHTTTTFSPNGTSTTNGVHNRNISISTSTTTSSGGRRPSPPASTIKRVKRVARKTARSYISLTYSLLLLEVLFDAHACC